MKPDVNIQLGCGLIRIGREWGFKKDTIPTNHEVQTFLDQAVKLGIRYFDTAPAYGVSEERLGAFIKRLSSEVKDTLLIATKCGEVWDQKSQSTIVDHSYKSLIKSIDHSFELLPKIDILQIHKANPQILKSIDVLKALEYAKSVGIKQVGASISDSHTADVVAEIKEIEVVQFPYNPSRANMQQSLQKLKAKDKFIVINRPFNMGSLIYQDADKKTKEQQLIEAYAFIIKEQFTGVILTGTSNPLHLQENCEAFMSAIK